MVRPGNSVSGRMVSKVLSGRDIKQRLKEGRNALSKSWGKTSPYRNAQVGRLGFPEVPLES